MSLNTKKSNVYKLKQRSKTYHIFFFIVAQEQCFINFKSQS